MTLIVNVVGLLLILGIIWWFWIAKPKSRLVESKGEFIDIIVENGVYSPAAIKTGSGEPINLRFIRKDASPCAEKVLFNSLGKTWDLSLGKATYVQFDALDKGVYEFTCQMGMYRGRLIIE
ncbi:MAG: cupredoxin domain-containing protein [Gammaproteobacteria bacterium]|nr:cupredoxin domain-containing protein [Gammaproteobacteria bacterium]